MLDVSAMVIYLLIIVLCLVLTMDNHHFMAIIQGNLR